MTPYTGTNFDDFLAEEGILEEVSAKALERLLVLQSANRADSALELSSLQEVWQGIIVSEQDFEASELTNPKFP